MIENINWYPGHMKKTREMIAANLKLVDLVVEVVDSRIPQSSRNPIIDQLLGDKPRIIALNKIDLANQGVTKLWEKTFSKQGYIVARVDARDGKGIASLFNEMESIQSNLNEGNLRQKPLRIMIVGVPNVGKSSLINRLTGRKATRIGNRPGVTKGKQWLKLKNGMELLDTPGILWPKFEDAKVGMNLAFCGSIKDEIMDLPTLAMELIGVLSLNYPELLIARYKLDDEPDEVREKSSLEVMEDICRKRGFIMAGKRMDYQRCGRVVLDEFRDGKIGHISLEFPEKNEIFRFSAGGADDGND